MKSAINEIKREISTSKTNKTQKFSKLLANEKWKNQCKDQKTEKTMDYLGSLSKRCELSLRRRRNKTTNWATFKNLMTIEKNESRSERENYLRTETIQWIKIHLSDLLEQLVHNEIK